MLTKTVDLLSALTLSGLVFAGGCAKSSEQSGGDGDQSSAFAQISATELVQEFYRDHKTAQKKYSGKILVVSGPAERVGANVANKSYVILRGVDSLGGVQCFWSDAAVGARPQPQIGTALTLRGAYSAFAMNVILDNCVSAK